MTIISGTSQYQDTFQGLLSERADILGETYLVPLVKLTTDSLPLDPNGKLIGMDIYAAFGETLVAQLSPQTAWRFDYGVNTRIISTTGTANGGFVTGSASMGVLLTGNSPSGTAVVFTRQVLRYTPGMGGLVRFTAVFNTGTANSEQTIGVGDNSDGFFFGYNGVDFGIMRRRGGVDMWTPISDWNGTPIDFTPQLGNIYQIRFQWLGFGDIFFYVFNGQRNSFINVHTIHFPNTSVVTSVLNPTLPVRAQIKNEGNNTNLTMFVPSAIGASEGIPSSEYQNPLNVRNSFDAAATFADTNKNHLLTIRNKTTFNGQANRVPIRIKSIDLSRSASVASATTTNVRIYRNAITAGALTFADIDTPNSPVDISITTTTITSTNAERSYTMSQSNSGRSIEFTGEGILVLPGESISIEIQDSGVQSTEAVVTVNWNEEF